MNFFGVNYAAVLDVIRNGSDKCFILYIHLTVILLFNFIGFFVLNDYLSHVDDGTFNALERCRWISLVMIGDVRVA